MKYQRFMTGAAWLLAAEVVLLAMAANATVLPPPATLCGTGTDCAIYPTPIYSADSVTFYRGFNYQNAGGSAPSSITLTRTIWAGYSLGSASHYFQPGVDPADAGDSAAGTRLPLPGTLWIEAQSTYTGSGDFAFNVYTPDRSTGELRKQQLLLSNEALMGARGVEFYSGGVGELPQEQIHSAGTMQPGIGPIVDDSCIECGWDLEFNLINFSYVEVADGEYEFQLNPEDDRSLIFRWKTTYYHHDEFVYSLAEVPLPSAGWLLLSSVIGLAWFGRR